MEDIVYYKILIVAYCGLGVYTFQVAYLLSSFEISYCISFTKVVGYSYIV